MKYDFMPSVGLTVVEGNYEPLASAISQQLMLASVIQGQQQADANAAAEEGEPFLGSGRLGMCQ
jgi:hypothetical protein